MLTQHRAQHLASFLLRLGLAFVLCYAAIAMHYMPSTFTKYVPFSVQHIIPLSLFLPLLGILEVSLSIWLLSGWYVTYPAVITALMMILIVIFNPQYFSVLFRNISIFFSALALAVMDTSQRAGVNK